jgi:hypothetical protein
VFSSKKGKCLPFGTKLDQEAGQKHLYAKLYGYTDSYSDWPVAGSRHGNWEHCGACNKQTLTNALFTRKQTAVAIPANKMKKCISLQ